MRALPSVVDSLPAPILVPTNAVASSLVTSWQGSMSVTTAVGSGVSLAASEAGADAGAGDGEATGATMGGRLAFASAEAIADGAPVLLEQPATPNAAIMAIAPAWRARTIRWVMAASLQGSRRPRPRGARSPRRSGR